MSLTGIGNHGIGLFRYLCKGEVSDGLRFLNFLCKAYNLTQGRKLGESHSVQHFASGLQMLYIFEFFSCLDGFIKTGLVQIGLVSSDSKKKPSSSDLLLKFSLLAECSTRFYDSLAKSFELKGTISSQARTAASVMGLVSGLLIAKGSISKLKEGKNDLEKPLTTAEKTEQYFWIVFGLGWMLAETAGLEKKFCKSGIVPSWFSAVTTALTTGGVIMAHYAASVQKEAKLKEWKVLQKNTKGE